MLLIYTRLYNTAPAIKETTEKVKTLSSIMTLLQGKTASSSNTGATINIRAEEFIGKKLREQHQKTLREHVSAPTSAFARKQLEKMGWKEGTGLGKKRDGITTHIRVSKREDQLGLGSQTAQAVALQTSQQQWWKDSCGDTLAKLAAAKQKKKGKKKSKDSSKKRKRIFTDEELFQATGGSRFGMRACPTKNLHKWIRAEGDETTATQGGVTDTAGANSASNSSSTLEDSKNDSKVDLEIADNTEATTTSKDENKSSKKSSKKRRREKDNEEINKDEEEQEKTAKEAKKAKKKSKKEKKAKKAKKDDKKE